MKVYVLTYGDTDGYTYSCEDCLIDLFDSFEKAESAAETWILKNKETSLTRKSIDLWDTKKTEDQYSYSEIKIEEREVR